MVDGQDQTLLWFAGSGLSSGSCTARMSLARTTTPYLRRFRVRSCTVWESPCGWRAQPVSRRWRPVLGCCLQARHTGGATSCLPRSLSRCRSVAQVPAGVRPVEGRTDGRPSRCWRDRGFDSREQASSETGSHGGVGRSRFVWDNASVVATGPALLAAVGADFGELKRRPGRSLAVFGGAVLTPLALVAFNHFWYAAHPGSSSRLRSPQP